MTERPNAFDPLEYRIGTLQNMVDNFDRHPRAYKKLFGRKRTIGIRHGMKDLIELYQETQHDTNLHPTNN